MICLLVLGLAVFTAPTPATSCDVRTNRTSWNSPPPGFAWVDAFFGDVPAGAVQGGVGPNGDIIYICRTFHHHNLIPGKVNAFMKNCDVAWGGAEHDVPFYQVLVNQNHTAEISWVEASDGNHPDNAVVGGYKCDCDGSDGDLEYIGRSNFDLCPGGTCLSSSVVYPGKVIQCLNAFYWSYGGNAYHSSTYQIAVWNYVTTTAPPTTTTTEPTTTTTYTTTPTTTYTTTPTTTYTTTPTTTYTTTPTTTYTTTETTTTYTTTEPTTTTTEKMTTNTDESVTEVYTTEVIPVSQVQTTAAPPKCGGSEASLYAPAPAGLVWMSGFSKGKYPDNAVEGGFLFGRKSYVCRVYKDDNVIPGDLGGGNCYYPNEGKWAFSPTYEVLAKEGDVDLSWVDDTDGSSPAGAVAAGYNCKCSTTGIAPTTPSTNYVGRTPADITLYSGGYPYAAGSMIIGNVNKCHRDLSFILSYGVASLTSYQSLVVSYPTTTVEPTTTEKMTTNTDESVSEVYTTEVIPVSQVQTTAAPPKCGGPEEALYTPAPAGLVWLSGFSDGKYPDNAVIGGSYKGKVIYVCRVYKDGSVIPGNLVNGYCIFPSAGKWDKLSTYDVLAKEGDVDISWVADTDGSSPAGAVAAGYNCKCSHSTPTINYVGRNYDTNSMTPLPVGSVVIGSVNKCAGNARFGYIVLTSYESLVVTTVEPTTTEKMTTNTDESVSEVYTTEVIPVSQVQTTAAPPKCDGSEASMYAPAPAGLVWMSGFSKGKYPDNAVPGGYNFRRNSYVCRVYKDDNVIAGNLLFGNCYYSNEGEWAFSPTYDVLAKVGDVDLSWVADTDGSSPAGAVAAGYNCKCSTTGIAPTTPTINYVGRNPADITLYRGTTPQTAGTMIIGNVNKCHGDLAFILGYGVAKLTSYESLVAS